MPTRLSTIRRPESVTRRNRRFRWVIAVVLLLGAVIIIRTTVVDAERVSSGSMAPTLCTGDVIMVSRTAVAGASPGDVVTFPEPGAGTAMIKRVVALAGQRVGLADGVLVVDGQPVAEPYVDLASTDGVYFGPVVVPAASVFVMGDDREVSIDSRTFGPVAVGDLDGRLLGRLWSGCP